MTTEEEWKARKEKFVRQLQAVNISAYMLEATDPRLLYYVTEVANNPEGHNLYEILGVLSFFRKLDRYVWKRSKVKKIIRFYECLKFSGLKGRRSYKMTPIQVFQYANIFGFYREAEVETENGEKTKVLRRLTEQAILFVPRKFSKTTSSASIAVYELLVGDANAQAYVAANSYKQAQICFKEISNIIRQLDPKKRSFKFTREHVEWRPNKYGKESFVECLTGGADTKDGLNASLVIFDEYAAAKYVKGHSDGAGLLQVLLSSMGAREEPLTVIITTASRVQDGPFQAMLEGAKSVLLGEMEDDSLFASLFMPDEWEQDDEHIGQESVWRKCNPHIGVIVQPDYYAKKWKKALRDPEEMLEFRSKLVNLFVADNVKEWVGRGLIKELTAKFDPRQLTGRPDAMCSFDLSVSDDFSAVAYTVYSEATKKFYSYCDFYIPEETLKSHPNSKLYELWVKNGYMKVCKGKVIDYEMVANDILEMNEHIRILQIGYDCYKSNEAVNILMAAISSMGGDGAKILKAVSQTQGSFNSPVEAFEIGAKRYPAQVVLDDNPIIRYCFANAYIEEDKMGNKKPFKRKANLKIDGVITILMNYWLFLNTEQSS